MIRPEITEWDFSAPEPLARSAEEPTEAPGQTPRQAAAPEAGSVGAQPTPIAQGIFLRWERWRLVYNAIVVLAVVLMGAVKPAGELSNTLTLAAAALALNIGYLLGPVLEVYLAWLGVRSRLVSLLLFTAQSFMGATAATRLLS